MRLCLARALARVVFLTPAVLPLGIATIGDFTLPIQGISVNFDNFSGLLANHTQYQLYKMSVANGLDMDFSQWSGEARDAASSAASPRVSLVGGPLILRPGRDFALQAGQAPGLVGNFTLQFSLTVGNQFSSQIAAGGVNLYVVPISSGFFETIKGSSRIIKGVLTEQDILGSLPHRHPEPQVIDSARCPASCRVRVQGCSPVPSRCLHVLKNSVLTQMEGGTHKSQYVRWMLGKVKGDQEPLRQTLRNVTVNS